MFYEQVYLDFGGEVIGGSLLKEVFTNIIRNSIQHFKGTKILITGEQKNNSFICKIEDDGKGVPDKNKEKIFEKGFKKGENAGSGLGMYLVKEIVESYGGSVEVKDSELGGARFDVHLKRIE